MMREMRTSTSTGSQRSPHVRQRARHIHQPGWHIRQPEGLDDSSRGQVRRRWTPPTDHASTVRSTLKGSAWTSATERPLQGCDRLGPSNPAAALRLPPATIGQAFSLQARTHAGATDKQQLVRERVAWANLFARVFQQHARHGTGGQVGAPSFGYARRVGDEPRGKRRPRVPVSTDNAAFPHPCFARMGHPALVDKPPVAPGAEPRALARADMRPRSGVQDEWTAAQAEACGSGSDERRNDSSRTKAAWSKP